MAGIGGPRNIIGDKPNAQGESEETSEKSEQEELGGGEYKASH